MGYLLERNSYFSIVPQHQINSQTAVDTEKHAPLETGLKPTYSHFLLISSLLSQYNTDTKYILAVNSHI